MLELGIPAWAIVVRTAVVYLAVLLGLRLMGKRELGQMTPFDFVMILLIANAVQNAMVGPDTSLTGGLVAAFVLLIANRAVAFVRTRTWWGRRFIQGTPTILVRDGHFVEGAMGREEIQRDDVDVALREHGIGSVADVALAVLETDGSISIVPRSTTIHRSPRRARQMKKH